MWRAEGGGWIWLPIFQEPFKIYTDPTVYAESIFHFWHLGTHIGTPSRMLNEHKNPKAYILNPVARDCCRQRERHQAKT